MTILVTGATGNVGRHVVRELLELGLPVRAFVRDPHRARLRLGPEVELATGDLTDPSTIGRALENVDRMFLACSNQPGQVQAEGNAISAAVAAGLDLVVKLSGPAPAADSPLIFERWHAQVEQVLDASGLAFQLLRPHSYMTNLLANAPQIGSTGQLFAPAGAARVSFVDPFDVGAVGARLLAGDEPARSRFPVTGPAAVSYHEIAADIAEAIGRPVVYVPVPDDAARQSMLAGGMPEPLVEAFLTVFARQRAGLMAGVTDVVPRLTGRPGRSFARFAGDNAEAFAGVAVPNG